MFLRNKVLLLLLLLLLLFFYFIFFLLFYYYFSDHCPANSYGFELALRTSYALFPFIAWWKVLLSFHVFMPLRDVIQQVVFMELERKKPG